MLHFLSFFALQDENYWPLMPPLPSYGYGREHPGPRYGSLIHGQNLKDIVITGKTFEPFCIDFQFIIMVHSVCIVHCLHTH